MKALSVIFFLQVAQIFGVAEAKSSLLDSVNYNKYIPADTVNPTSWLLHGFLEYRGGILGTKKIGIYFAPGVKSGDLVGHYFYYGDMKDIPLEGKITGNRNMILFEKDSLGDTLTTFSFHFPEYDSSYSNFRDHRLSTGVLIGKWTSISGLQYDIKFTVCSWGKPREHRYSSTSNALTDKDIEKNMQKFYFAVLGGDKLAVANYVYYPFVVNIKHKSITLRDQTEFLRYYDKIFTKKMIKIFKNDVPHDLNSIGNGGILFLSGTVWFNLDGVPKIININ